MALQCEYRDGELTVHLTGELDHHTAQKIREEADGMAERLVPRRMRLDFAGVSFMDSSGVGLVMGRYRLMQSLGGSLTVCGMNARIGAMMRLAGLDRLDIWETQKRGA